MFVLESYTLAVVFCIVTMICWGSWANTQKFVQGTWRFELYYWDYTIGILLSSLLIAFTLGSYGNEGRSFIPDLMQADSSSLIAAFLGGLIFNLANILLTAAISVVGMSVAFPIIIGIALAWGVVINYLDAPIGDPIILFSGVGLIIIAIILNALAYHKKSGNKIKISKIWIVLSVFSGILMGYFYNFVAGSMFSDFYVPLPGKLSPYSSVVIFSIGIFISNLLFNSVMMRFNPSGKVVKFKSYFQGNYKSHMMGFLGGTIWLVGMSFSIIASGVAGPAISYGLGQGATIVAAIWGIFIWKEFEGADKKVNLILALMMVLYLLGIVLIIFSR